MLPGRVAAEDETLTGAVRPDDLERPELARRTAREPTEALDGDALGAEPARDVRRQPLAELDRRRRLPSARERVRDAAVDRQRRTGRRREVRREEDDRVAGTRSRRQWTLDISLLATRYPEGTVAVTHRVFAVLAQRPAFPALPSTRRGLWAVWRARR